ncbi:MAG: hypothetical protein JOZ38_00940, partial [Candidatus Eremiobacteraeota bacterium]|nr:hypothetical protein [Candidatus Eremiobacteraeota bacterium]
QRGVGAGALLEMALRIPRVELLAEGIPVVSTPQAASAHYGQATPALGIFTSTLDFGLDRFGRLWLGAGTFIVNQRTPLPNLNQVVSSRLAGGRYEFIAHLPVQSSHFVEFRFGAAPRLFGADHYLFSDGSAAVDRDEQASEVDMILAYGVRHAHSSLLFGLRSLDFAAKFTDTGELADRNQGVGIMIEAQRDLGF